MSDNPAAEKPMCSGLQPLKRVNYFSGKLLTAEDLRAEQEYVRERSRRHNRYFHGWGVVCGLEVGLDQAEVTIAPGFAIDCQGEELILAAPGTLCPPAQSPPLAGLYVLISPSEEMTDPIPLADGVTEHARVIEGSRLVLDPEDPTVDHVRRRGHGQPCGAAHGVPLARLEWKRRQWRIDSRYRPCRTR
jgi:hypothetical protein